MKKYRRRDRGYYNRRGMWIVVAIAVIVATMLSLEQALPVAYAKFFPLKTEVTWEPATAPLTITLKVPSGTRTVTAAQSPWRSGSIRYELNVTNATSPLELGLTAAIGQQLASFSCRIWQRGGQGWQEQSALIAQTRTSATSGTCVYKPS